MPWMYFRGADVDLQMIALRSYKRVEKLKGQIFFSEEADSRVSFVVPVKAYVAIRHIDVRALDLILPKIVEFFKVSMG